MSEPIRFDRTKFDSKGRNGYIGTTGINVVDLGEELFLEPITTRGINSEACRIVLPKSAITALIEALDEIAPISAVIADFGSTIRQASLLMPRVVIGSRNNSSPRSTTLMPVVPK